MEAEAVFLACPSKPLRRLCECIDSERMTAQQLKLLIIMCKGLEAESFKTPSEIVRETLPDITCGILSGPSGYIRSR